MAEKRFQVWVRNKYGAIIGHSAPSDKPLFNNADRIARIFYRLGAYRRLSWFMLRHGVSPRHIIRTQFPLLEPRASAPLLVSLEFTNLCNLRCVYCASPVSQRKRGFMSREILARTVEGIKRLGVSRVRVVGEGESTLHPDFALFMGELGAAAPFVSIVTNCQWKHPQHTIDALLAAPTRLIEISVDSANKAGYEQSRPGGRFENLIENLQLLKAAKQKTGSKTLTNIRLMVRPSERPLEKQLTAFWRKYADTVMPQPLVERKDQPYVDDLYKPAQFDDQSYPKCSLPFKELIVNWNGDMPLCGFSVQQVGAPGLVVGNVMTKPLDQLWNEEVMRQYREGHCQRDPAKMAICKGCSGV